MEFLLPRFSVGRVYRRCLAHARILAVVIQQLPSRFYMSAWEPLYFTLRKFVDVPRWIRSIKSKEVQLKVVWTHMIVYSWGRLTMAENDIDRIQTEKLLRRVKELEQEVQRLKKKTGQHKGLKY